MSWQHWLADQAEQRRRDGLVRRLRPRSSTDSEIDLAGNDYLGLATDPEVVAGAVAAAEEWGGGAGASRLVTGTLELHARLEAALAEFMGWSAGLVLSSGYHANLAAVTALADRDTLILSDAHVHASLIDGARLSRAQVDVVAHNDPDAVRAALAGAGAGRRVLVLVESVYSVLGDAAHLGELAAACHEYGALLIVDEAHGLGVAGPAGHGLVAALGLAGRPGIVVTATLSKALGSQGGVILADPAVIEQVVNRARPFIYDTGLAPAATGAAFAALGVLSRRPELVQVIRRRIEHLAGATGETAPAGAVLSVPMNSPEHALATQAACLRRGVRVGCFRPPSTPDGLSRLRITAGAGPGESAWTRAVGIVSEEVGR